MAGRRAQKPRPFGTREPVLVITTSGRPQTVPVRIFGRTYQLRDPEQLQVGGFLFLQKHGPRMDELWAKGDALNDDERVEFDALLSKLLGHVLDAPAEVREKLTPVQKLAVASVFVAVPNAPRA